MNIKELKTRLEKIEQALRQSDNIKPYAENEKDLKLANKKDSYNLGVWTGITFVLELIKGYDFMEGGE